MLVAVGALLSLTGANKKAQNLQSVMNNLNISVDSMVRNMRMGMAYHCGTGDFEAGGVNDCATGGTAVTFTCNPDTPSCAATGGRWAYGFNIAGCPAGAICKSTSNGSSGTWSRITAPQVTVNSMTVYVVGSTRSDTVQPKVIVVIKGEAGTGKTLTTFHIQATAVQRELDL